MRRIRLVWGLCVLSVVSCATAPSRDTLTPKQLARQLKAAGGWRMLPFPDSKYEPGSILVVSEHDGIRWMGHLRTACHVPDELLVPTEGAHPAITIDRETQFSAEWLVTYADKITAGPEFEKVGFLGVTLGESSAPAIDSLRLWAWLEEEREGGRLPEICANVLALPNTYVVNESFRVSNARFRLLDRRRQQIALLPASVSRFLRFGGDLKAGVTSSGEVVISQPVYIAVRGIRQTGTGIGLASDRRSGPATAEELFDRIIARYPWR